jgi:hypothetical protein
MSVAPRIPVSYPDPGFPLVAVASVGTSERLGRYHLHTAADWELCYVSSGQTNLLVGGRKRRLCAGEVLVIRPDEPHATAPTRGRRHTLIFRQRLLRAMPFRARAGAAVGIEVAGKRLSGLLTVVSQRRPAVEHLLERLEQESFGSEATKQAMCAALLAELLLELARSAKEAGQPRQSPVSPIARRTVEQLCAEVQAELDHPWTLSS